MSLSKATLKRNSELAISAPEGTPVPQDVWLPPTVRGKSTRVMHDIAVTRSPPTVSENMIRINEEADPIGLLIAISNGQPISTFQIDDKGETILHWETLPLKDRLKVIYHLADKILPRMSRQPQKTAPAKGDPDSWNATLENAAERKGS